MEQNIRQVKAKSIVIPQPVIKHVGDILDWPVMDRERIKEEVMSETLENKKGTLDEGIVTREIIVVPDKLPRKGGCVNDYANRRKKEQPEP